MSRGLGKIEKNAGDEKTFSIGTAHEFDFDSEFVKIFDVKPKKIIKK